MKWMGRMLMLAGLLVMAPALWAKTVVLIHGLASGPGVWYKEKVIQPLLANGWADGGVLPMVPNYMATKQAPNVVYTVKLPWWAPLEVQTRLLDGVLKRLYAERKEPVILVGHSTGGIVARLYSLAPEQVRVPVAGIVTIASPNRGTPFAKMAWHMLKSPIGKMMKEMDDKSERLYLARRLLWQISTDEHNPVEWMKYARHPEGVKYVSLVHTRKMDFKRGDFGLIVPPKYQDLRRVPALSGRAQSYPVPAGHKLSAKDGGVLAQVLNQF